MKTIMTPQTSETKNNSTETLPEYLSAARVSFSFTVNQVSKMTGISNSFIQDLEKGAYHRLPAEVYVYGFLRQLADLYGVSSEDLISQYKKERAIHDSIYKRGGNYKSVEVPKVVITPKVITLGLLGVFVVFILGYLFYQVNAVNKPPQIVITSPVDNARVPTSSVIVQGKTDPGTTITMNDQQMFVDSSGEFKQPVSISPGQQVLLFLARNNFGKSSSKQIVIIGDFQSQEQQNHNQTDPLQLTLTVGPNSTVVSVKIDEGVFRDETFIAGSSKTYTAKSRVVISTGDAGSTSITLNGRDLGKLGRDGEVLRNIPFTIDSVIAK
jgi:cytoskeletal protein RodZ